MPSYFTSFSFPTSSLLQSTHRRAAGLAPLRPLSEHILLGKGRVLARLGRWVECARFGSTELAQMLS